MPASQPFTVACDGGSYLNEVEWVIYNCDGELILSGGAPYSECIDELPDTYTIAMFDSWGDGWNGGSLNIGLPETDISVALEDGSLGYATFEVGIDTDACVWDFPGCTDPNAENYTAGATVDDGTCFVPEIFLTSEDDERSYFLYTPDGLEADAPLIFVLHGYYGDNMGMMTVSGMNDIADSEGFAVCYPVSYTHLTLPTNREV